MMTARDDARPRTHAPPLPSVLACVRGSRHDTDGHDDPTMRYPAYGMRACGVRCDTDIWGSGRFPPAAWGRSVVCVTLHAYLRAGDSISLT